MKSFVQADVEWSLKNQIKLDVTPLDLASSSDGLWVYILAPGEIEVYSAFDNRVIERIPIGWAYDKITYSAQINSLIVSRGWHPARRSVHCARTIRLDWRPRLIRLFRSAGAARRNPADHAHDGFPGAARCVRGFLDVGVQGYRRLIEAARSRFVRILFQGKEMSKYEEQPNHS